MRRLPNILAILCLCAPLWCAEGVVVPDPGLDDEALLTAVQKATFRYFWDYGHPVSGAARERLGSGETCTSGGTGFGLMAILVGTERGFVTRDEAAARVLKLVTFLQEKAERHHGVWPHWFNGTTGKTIPFSRFDDGGDLVETAFLAQGLLTVRQYFTKENEPEAEIRRRCTELWRGIEWKWHLGEPPGRQLIWHWSPNHDWKMNHRIGGHFNECLIVYLLAIASPTHPIPPECYAEGWVKDPKTYAPGGTRYGIEQRVGWTKGVPLFFTHYSFLGFDPRGWSDPHCSYFENHRNIALIHRAYAIENPGKHKGYGAAAWGLTACDIPNGYNACSPANDNGTIAPTAALSCMPYTPKESMEALRYFLTLGPKLWGEYGFRDAYNLDRDWFAESYLAIDQGPIVVMIENYRTQLCWKLFMSNPEIEPALRAAGWKSNAIPAESTARP